MKYGDVKLVSAQSNENGDFDGTMYVWNSTDNMSDGIFREFVNSIFNPPEDDPSFDFKIVNDVIHTVFDPFVSPSMMTQLILEQVKNEKKSGAKIFDDDDVWQKRAEKRITYALKAGAPGFATQVYDLLESWQPDTFLSEDELKYMKKSFLHEAMSFTGNRFSRFNIQENFKYGVKEVITNLNNTKPREKEEVNVFNRVKRHCFV